MELFLSRMRHKAISRSTHIEAAAEPAPFDASPHGQTRLRERENLEQRYRALASAAAQVVWMWSAATPHTLSFLGEWWEVTTGQSAEDRSAFGWLDVIHPEDRAYAKQTWEDALARGENLKMEYRLRARAGGYLFVDVRGTALLGADGSVREFIGTLNDITAQREMERQREELEQFAHVLVHDLKEPINSIKGLIDSIEESVQEGKPEKIAEDYRFIMQSAYRMGVLIDTLHQYTKADERVPFEPVEMDSVIRDTLADLRRLIQAKGARVTHDALPAVIGNAAQLVQLLQNLIGNGIKYCEAADPCVHISCAPYENGALLFSVKDNGIGISEEYCRQVFEPFKRLHGMEAYEGVGLGLATCEKIVERHGGSIWCESRQGQGATFFFTLPAA